MDEILQLSPIREGKLQEDLQTMLISNEKKVTIHSKINFSSLGTYKLLYTSDVVRRNAQWNLPPPPPAWSSLVFRSLKIFHPQWNDLH